MKPCGTSWTLIGGLGLVAGALIACRHARKTPSGAPSAAPIATASASAAPATSVDKQTPTSDTAAGGGPVESGTIEETGQIANASKVLGAMRAGFRACYEHGLEQDKNAQGTVRLTIRVSPTGKVQKVVATSTGHLPSSVVSCIRTRARTAKFSPPSGGSAVVMVPITFVHQ